MTDPKPKKDAQTVTPKGERIRDLIEGVIVYPLTTHVDERGEVCEIYNPAWGIHAAPLVYAYSVMIRPGKAKGWTMHLRQDDRHFVVSGTARYALYDQRPNSLTSGKLCFVTFGERNRAMLIIPAGVYHAAQNVGLTECFLVNLPTCPYNHADPDKYRLPLKNDLIPYAFEDGPGW